MTDQQMIQQGRKGDKLRGKADIVLLIDRTESMQPCIENLKKNIIDNFLKVLDGTVTKDQQKVDWRGRVISYGDVEADGEHWIDLSNALVSEPEKLKSQIESIKLSGGGDLPESTLDAIYLAMIKSDWNPGRHHFIVVFSDADSHPQMHEKVLEQGEDPSVAHLMQELVSRKIKVYGVLPESATYRELLNLLPKSKLIAIGKPGEEDTYKGLANQRFDELMKGLAATISESSGEIVTGS